MKKLCVGLAALTVATSPSFTFALNNKVAKVTFEENCASCHGYAMEGGMAESMLDDTWSTDGAKPSLVKAIKEGMPEKGMPAWGNTLTDEEIFELADYIQVTNAQHKVGIRPVHHKPIKSGNTLQFEKLATATGILWGMDFLPDGTMLLTQRDGILWHFDGRKLSKIDGTPKVWAKGQGGLLDVGVHPDYEKNGWVYLSFAHSHDDKKAMTKIVRGKINKNTWQGEQTIYQADASTYVKKRAHFGSRIVFQDGYIFFGIGDRGFQNNAQELSLPNGKMFRLHDDGRIPADNPFINNKHSLPEIWSYGHRNPQGLAIHKETGELWLSEHGPKGGDEINHVEKGLNYGWPVITYGINYSGTKITDFTAKPGMEQPKHYWVPSIATSGIDFYAGDKHPEWNNKLLVTGMSSKELHLLSFDLNGTVTRNEIVHQDDGRIRDVSVAPDGSVYLLVTHNKKGQLMKLKK